MPKHLHSNIEGIRSDMAAANIPKPCRHGERLYIRSLYLGWRPAAKPLTQTKTGFLVDTAEGGHGLIVICRSGPDTVCQAPDGVQRIQINAYRGTRALTGWQD
jgi:hypothetical protein